MSAISIGKVVVLSAAGYWFLNWVFALAIPLFLVLRAVQYVSLLRVAPVDLNGEVIIVTGAAGGFGSVTSAMLLERGAVVYGLDVVDAAGIQDAVGKKLPSGRQDLLKSFRPIQIDLSDFNAIVVVAQRIKDELGNQEIYALVNNAGLTGKMCAAIETTTDNLNKVMGVNFLSAAYLSRELYPKMKKCPSANGAGNRPSRGRIVNITSCAGLVSASGLSCYNASKFALEAFSDCTRLELKDSIDVSIIEPFFAATGIYRYIFDTSDEELKKSVLGDQFLAKKARAKKEFVTPGKLMTPEFVCGYIVQALTHPVPQDRYLVTPNLVVEGLMRVFAHAPNYFLWVDGAKALLEKLGL